LKILPFEKLNRIDFALKNISVIYQVPEWSSVSSIHREMNGFILIDKGKCHYTWDGDEANLLPGSLLYLSKGSKKKMVVTEREFAFYRINFDIIDISDGEEVIFCIEPWVVFHDAAQNYFDLCEKLLTTSMSISISERLFSVSQLSEFLACIGRYLHLEKCSKITPAIDHIEKHYNEDTDIPTLASMCYLSEPHFYRLFKNETDMTPIEYRSRLRLERAQSLLSYGSFTVSEIASMLGFNSVYYFSRFFKQRTGFSPIAYMKNHDK